MTHFLWYAVWPAFWFSVAFGSFAYGLRNVSVLASWGWFAFVQLVMFVFMVIGWVLLIPFCLAHAWRPSTSIADSKRVVDCWSFGPLNYIYANPEDGVSGKYAVVWANGVQVPYMPLPAYPYMKPDGVGRWLWEAWRAYCWSAWRNSVDALKYWFSWENGPQTTIRGHKLGWWPENGYKVPLL